MLCRLGDRNLGPFALEVNALTYLLNFKDVAFAILIGHQGFLQ
jgi:hypothetical protein